MGAGSQVFNPLARPLVRRANGRLSPRAFALSVKPPAVFPGGVATDADLLLADNRVGTVLAAPISATDASIIVADPTVIEQNAVVSLDVDGEIVQIVSGPLPPGNVFLVVRGFDSTTPVAHAAGAQVLGNVVAFHHNALVSEIEAIEATLGANLTNVHHQVFNVDFIFPPQTPNAALTAGVPNTITLQPVPSGVNGSDTKHYLYISGGTGPAEAVLIAGGTAVSGAPSGSITFTPAFNHSGPWTIQTATAGIGEAAQYVHTLTNGGQVIIVAGNWTMYAAAAVFQNTWYLGFGPASVLIPASSSTIVFDANVPVKISNPSLPAMQVDEITFSDFTIDAQTVSTGDNSIYGMRFTNNPSSTETWSFLGITFRNIIFNNIRYAIYLERAFRVNIDRCLLTLNSTVFLGDSSLNSAYHTTLVNVVNTRYFWALLQNGTTVYVPVGRDTFTLQFTESVYFNNCVFFNYPAVSGQIAIHMWGQCEDMVVNQSLFESCWRAISFDPLTIGSVTYFPDSCRIQDCTIDQGWSNGLIYLGTGLSQASGQQVQQITITGNEFTNLEAATGGVFNTFINIQAYSKNIIISDNLFAQVNLQQENMIIVEDFTQDIVFSRNIFQQDGPPFGIGIQVWPTAMVQGLEDQVYTNLFQNVNDMALPVAAAATIAVPVARTIVPVNGAVNITAITYAGQIGAIFTLMISATLTVFKGNNLELNSNFATTGVGVGTLTLYWNGTNAIELSRSAN